MRLPHLLPTTAYNPLTHPFLLHALIELPASLQFLLLPSRQLGRPMPHAHALIRQYALLLASSVVIALTFYFQDASFLPSGDALALLDAFDAEAPGRLLAREVTGGRVGSGFVRAQVAAALAVYHVGPVVRSIGRLKGQWTRGEGLLWCEAGLYLLVHTVVGWELGRCAWLCWR